MTGRNLLPPTWEADTLANTYPTSWYWERDAGYTKEEEERAWKTRIYTSTTFWANLSPMPGTVEVMKRMNALAKQHDLYFLTNRAGKQAKAQTEAFLYKHGVSYPTVLLTGSDKTPLINGLGLDFFIDDKGSTIEMAAKECKVRHLFLKDTPYNQGTQGGIRVPDVKAALEVAGLWSLEDQGVKKGKNA